MKNINIDAMANIIGQVERAEITATIGLKNIKQYVHEVSAVDFLQAFWPMSRRYAKGSMVETLKMGNMKLDKSIGIFSLPAVDSCPNCKDCMGKCYALKPQKMRPSVRRSRFLAWVLADIYPTALWHMTIAQIKNRNIQAVRIHESGDFFSKQYVNVWIEIAKACPETRFYFYTKTAWYEISELASMENVNMVSSILPDGELNFGTPAYVAEMQAKYHFPICPATNKNIDQEKVKCGKTCKLCQLRANVLFFVH